MFWCHFKYNVIYLLLEWFVLYMFISAPLVELASLVILELSALLWVSFWKSTYFILAITLLTCSVKMLVQTLFLVLGKSSLIVLAYFLLFSRHWCCWTSFPSWKVSSFFNLWHMRRKKLKQTMTTCGLHKARFCFSYRWIYGISNKL